MKKRTLASILLLLSFALVSTFSFAITEYWLIDERGAKLTEEFVAEISDDFVAPMLRIRQDDSSVGQVSDGDSITIVLKNAIFNETPIILAPKADNLNVKGLTGPYTYTIDSANEVSGSNYFTIKFKKDDYYTEDYKNIDIVIDFGPLKVLSENDLSLIITAESSVIVNNQKVLSDKNINLAKVKQANSGKDSFTVKSYEIQPSILEEGFAKEGFATLILAESHLRFYPEFFTKNAVLWDFFLDRGFNIKVDVAYTNQPRFVNTGSSKLIDAEIIQLNFTRVDRVGNFVDKKIEKNEGLALVFKGLDAKKHSLSERNKIYGVEYIKDEKGFFEKKIVEKTQYNIQRNEYIVPVSNNNTYSIELFDVMKKITMNIGSNSALVDFLAYPIDVPPMLIQNSTYVPLRFIAENLGAQVEFLQATNQVEIKTTDKTVYLPIDKVTEQLATPARIVDGRTLVPARYVSEQLGATVNWIADTRTIEIIK